MTRSSTTSQLKRAQGYLAPSQRDGCRSCAHRSETAIQLEFGASYECQLGGFLVSPGGICPRHQSRPAIRQPKELK